MKTEWDYTQLADAYLKRPDYSAPAVEAMLKVAELREGDICDVGAGVAHLTLMLAARGFAVTAIEPNDSMRANGRSRTAHLPVRWFEGTGEATGMPSHAFDLVTFGSSFNVTDRPKALRETARILRPGGWFACMWNHRDLADPIQSEIENIIRRTIPSYGYGTRREDQTPVINASGLFGPVVRVEADVMHGQSVSECLEAWRSHATLARQAGGRFDDVIRQVEDYLSGLNVHAIEIPYTTRIWVARLR